jgi:outer membrane protein
MRRLVVLLGILLMPVLASAQAVPPMQAVTFEEAVRRAVTNNPSVQQAAAGILRAETILQQVNARSRPSVDAAISANVIGPVTQFSGSSIVPRTQTATTASFVVPLIAPANWALRNQAGDQVLVSQRIADDARRQVAIATAQAYLGIITARRVLELNERALENARAHYSYADQRFQGGIGSRLNALRAQQEVSATEARVEEARLGIRRAQEALGVLIAADGPADAAAEPTFEVPTPAVPDRDLVYARSDLRSIVARQTAAERVAGDAWRENLPSVTALFSPQVLAPAGLFNQPGSWRASVQFSVPLFDSGERRGRARERAVLVDLVRYERANAERQAGSEIRTAREAVAATERALQYARAAAGQANEVVGITDVAFREGATTNIEVIDAQRRARDAETAAAIAEDAVRRARLELLVATGRFPATP